MIMAYNTSNDFENCLGSIFAQTFSDFEIIWVDSSLSDDSPQGVRELYPPVRIISMSANVGYRQRTNIRELMRKPDIRDIRRPCHVRSVYGKAFQKIRIDLIFRAVERQPRFRIDGHERDLPHQPVDPFAADLVTLRLQPGFHPPHVILEQEKMEIIFA